MDARLLEFLNNNEQNYPHTLESQFPQVFEKIMALWDTPGFDAYMADLMTTTRSNRQGFPQGVASDVIYLSMLHDSGDTPNWAQALRDDTT